VHRCNRGNQNGTSVTVRVAGIFPTATRYYLFNALLLILFSWAIIAGSPRLEAQENRALKGVPLWMMPLRGLCGRYATTMWCKKNGSARESVYTLPVDHAAPPASTASWLRFRPCVARAVSRKRGLVDVRIEETERVAAAGLRAIERKIGIAEHISIDMAFAPQDGMGGVVRSHMAPVGQELRWGCPQSTFKRKLPRHDRGDLYGATSDAGPSFHRPRLHRIVGMPRGW
jgi:hypothetical protein